MKIFNKFNKHLCLINLEGPNEIINQSFSFLFFTWSSLTRLKLFSFVDCLQRKFLFFLTSSHNWTVLLLLLWRADPQAIRGSMCSCIPANGPVTADLLVTVIRSPGILIDGSVFEVFICLNC